MAADPFAALKDQVAIVTGWTAGIGMALAGALTERGVKLVLNGLGDPARSSRSTRRCRRAPASRFAIMAAT